MTRRRAPDRPEGRRLTGRAARGSRANTPFTGHPDALFYSVRAVAVKLDCSIAKVRAMIRDGDLAAVLVRGEFRVAIAEFDRRFPSR